MARRKKQKIILQPGWAIYLRTSDKDAQNPVQSQDRQRFAIHRSILDRSELPLIDEYSDTLTGRTPNRTSYQRMLQDARSGMFSHVAVERADRFGRNDTEALRAIDELDALGIAVRFANHPDLNPMDPDDRIIVALSFTLARRESMLSGMRIKSAGEAKRNNGGYLGRTPDGYISVEDDHILRKSYQRKTHHIEIDPDRGHIWREAWDLLLEDRHTLAEICEILHARGYRYRSGRPFVDVKPNGKRKYNYNTLSLIYHNWTYAGWIVSERHKILPKTQRGNWEPLVSTEEFERGLQILERRVSNRIMRRKHNYLLRGLLFLAADPTDPTQPGEKLYRLVGSTSNPNRKTGGNSHYRLDNHPIHFPCGDVESQLVEELKYVHVEPDLIPMLRDCYTEEVAAKLGYVAPDERAEIEKTLKTIDEEESRVLRLYAAGTVSEENWKGLWAEWQDKRQKLRLSLDALDQRCDTHIRDLDDALTIIAKLGILFENLSYADQRELLRNVVERVVVNTEGKIDRVEYHPPFAYLKALCDRVNCGGATSETRASNEKDSPEAACSSVVFSCGLRKTQSEPLPQHKTKTAHFLQQLTFPQSADLMRLSNKS